MLIKLPIFVSHFPYVQFKDIKIFESKTVYEKYSVGNDVISDLQKKIVDENRQLLLDNRVPLNKIRFVFTSEFTYDIDKNIINPKYDVMLPIKISDGNVCEKSPLIEIGKPENCIVVRVNTYKVPDNYKFIKFLIKESKKGVVIFIADDMTILNHKKEPYHFSVDSEYIRLINLDDAIEFYKFDTLWSE
jgi:hypothetical protein